MSFRTLILALYSIAVGIAATLVCVISALVAGGFAEAHVQIGVTAMSAAIMWILGFCVNAALDVRDRYREIGRK